MPPFIIPRETLKNLSVGLYEAVDAHRNARRVPIPHKRRGGRLRAPDRVKHKTPDFYFRPVRVTPVFREEVLSYVHYYSSLSSIASFASCAAVIATATAAASIFPSAIMYATTEARAVTAPATVVITFSSSPNTIASPVTMPATAVCGRVSFSNP